MRRNAVSKIIGSVAFLLGAVAGAGLVELCGGAQTMSRTTAFSLPMTALGYTGSPSNADVYSDCERLPRDHPQRAKLNGTRLRLSYSALPKDEREKSISGAKVVPLSDGRIVVGLGGTLYMLDRRGRVRWRYEASWILWDFAVVESSGLIYGSAGDNVMFVLDAATGKELLANGRNGKAAYGQVVPYGKDQCLITDDMSGYRDALDEWSPGAVPETDRLTAWRGTEELWSRDFPPDAEIVVKGGRVFAITKTRTAIYVSAVSVPKSSKLQAQIK